MKIYDMTTKNLETFHLRLERVLGVKFLNSNSAKAKKIKGVLGKILEKLKIPQSILDLRPMCIEDYILLPYQPASTRVKPLRQVLLATHECAHAMRVRAYVGDESNAVKKTLRWYVEYFTNDKFRALEEAYARATSAEVEYWLYGGFPGFIGDTLRTSYLCGQDAITIAEVGYNHRRLSIRGLGRGVCLDKASKFAVETLKQIGVEIN